MKQSFKEIIYNKYWNFISVFKSWLFRKGIIKKYRFKNEIFYIEKTNIKRDIYDFKSKNNYWEEQNSFSLANYFSDRYKKREEMLKEFLPHLGEKPLVLDVGCGSGEWSAKIAPYCSHVDAFDYSSGMIDNARKKHNDLGNLSFVQGDACSIDLKQQYDGAMALGLFMYLDNIDALSNAINNISKHIKKDGYFYSCDTINTENKDFIYLYNIKNGYKATYYSQECIFYYLNKAGLQLIDIKEFDLDKSRKICFKGIGSIWKKVK